MKRCDNCGSKLVNGGITTPGGSFCNSDCAHGMVLAHQCVERRPVPEYEVKFTAEEPVPIYPIPESVTSRIKKHCTRCASIIGAEGWKGISGIFCSKECAIGQEIPPVAPPVKEEITLFDHYAAHAIAAIIQSNRYPDTPEGMNASVRDGMDIADKALEERKKHIND